MIRCFVALSFAMAVAQAASAAEPNPTERNVTAPSSSGSRPAAPKVAERYALLIGVDDYAYAQKLKYCGADQVALSKQLVAAGFPADQVFLLHDKAENARLRPSKGNIERQLNLVLNLADADDLVVIAFSGHGLHLGDKSYLCPAECSLDDPKTLISVDDIYDRLKQCAAGFKLVLVDACRNDPRPGGTRALGATEGTRALARTLQDLKLPEGVVLLNSCAPGEVSWEEEKFGHGVFMHYVLDGLQGAADTSRDAHVSLSELQAYAGQRTKTFVANRFSTAQRPFFKGDLTTEALDFALLPVPGGGDRFDKTKQASLGVWTGDDWLQPVVWGVLRGSPADLAGVEPGDFILSLGGKPTVNAGDIIKHVGSYRPGDTIEVALQRGDARLRLQAVLEAASEARANAQLNAMSEAGDPVATTMLAVTSSLGSGGAPKDEQEALKLLRRAAESGDAVALHHLAQAYYSGDGVAQDYAEAVRLLEAARAATGPLSHRGAYGCAAALLGEMYQKGEGVIKDASRAAELFREASKVGHPAATWNLGTCYQFGDGAPQDFGKALTLYQEAATLHYSAAEFSIGYMFDEGKGVQADPQTARVWYERAVVGGSISAEVNLAILFRDGRGGPRDTVRAVSLFRSAADEGSVLALRHLGHCYFEGEGVTRDYAKAMEFFQSAADKGDHTSLCELGDMYEEGLGVPADFQKAKAFYEKAAEFEDSDGNYYLGCLYSNTEGPERDYAKAMKYFLLAAAKNDPDAENNIGSMILNGEGVQRDYTAARGWYESAASHGSAMALYHLGVIYEDGLGVPKNPIRAADYYRKAADLGYDEAKKKLE